MQIFIIFLLNAEVFVMIIKANGAELEITDTIGVYLGLPKKGQIFKNRDELSDNTVAALLKIQDKAESLVKRAEQLLSE
jgi:hypothetical protein